MKPRLPLVVTSAGIAFLAAIFGISRLQRSEFLKPDAQRTRQAVLTRVPLGTSILRAKNIMESEGFNCSMLYKTSFSEDQPAGPQISHPPANVLWCDSGEHITSALLISKRWQVNFVEKDGLVSFVAVGVGLTGP